MQTCLSGSVDGLRRRREASQKQMQGTDDRELVTDSRQHLPSHFTSAPIGTSKLRQSDQDRPLLHLCSSERHRPRVWKTGPSALGPPWPCRPTRPVASFNAALSTYVENSAFVRTFLLSLLTILRACIMQWGRVVRYSPFRQLIQHCLKWTCTTVRRLCPALTG